MTTELNDIDKAMVLNELNAMNDIAFVTDKDTDGYVSEAVFDSMNRVLGKSTNAVVKECTYNITRALRKIEKKHPDYKGDVLWNAFKEVVSEHNQRITEIIKSPNHTVEGMLAYYGIGKGDRKE